MKRVAITAAVVLSVGFLSAGTAGAQIVYGVSRPAGGGVYNSTTVLAPGGYQTYNSFFNPWSGVVQKQVYGSNWLGQTYGRSFGYNPWNGLSYNSGFFVPNYYVNPFGGYSYGFFRRW